MTPLTLPVIGRFVAVVFAALLIDWLVRKFLGTSGSLSGLDVAFAIAAAVVIVGGSLSGSRNRKP